MGPRGLWGREARLARADSGLRDESIEARDCDLGFSPLTNMMPVRRHGLSVAGDHFDILAAWVSVPIYSCTHLVSVTSLLALTAQVRSFDTSTGASPRASEPISCWTRMDW